LEYKQALISHRSDFVEPGVSKWVGKRWYSQRAQHNCTVSRPISRFEGRYALWAYGVDRTGVPELGTARRRCCDLDGAATMDFEDEHNG
jgi:hypothetical protein